MGRDRNTYPNLSGAEAREAIERDRLADEAIDKAGDRSLLEILARPMNERTRKLSEQENRRVAQMLARDRAETAKAYARAAAEVEVAQGTFVNLSDTAMEPTPEWLEKHDSELRPFTPAGQSGTVRTMKSVRRVVTPVVKRMANAGHIDDDQLRACLWYRYVFGMAGLEGRYAATRFADALDGTPLPGAAGHIPMTIHEAEARRAVRDAQKAIPSSYLRFFNALVIDDIPIYRCYRLARCSKPTALKRFKRLAQKLTLHCEDEGISLQLIDRDRHEG